MLRYLILLLIILSCELSFAQKEGYIWTFGDSAAVDFNSGSPVPLIGTALYSSESSSTICDINGNLLFYAGPNILTGGWEAGVFNKYNHLIQNGTGVYNNSSSSQGCVLFPNPADTNLFYLFTHRADASIADYKIYYSVIDKSANSDSGAVLVKNVPLPGIVNMSSHMIAIRHGNGIDWWLITHKGNGNPFYKYLIDSSGIHGPYIQAIGSSFPQFSAIGQMEISPDGTKLINVSFTTTAEFVDLYDFDRCTGTFSNWISLETNSSTFISNHYYGASFSPNSNILYVSKVDSGIFQYNLLSANIQGSRQLIWLKSDTSGLIGQHKLGPDNKIYISNDKNSPPLFNIENMNLSVINSPDSLGVACDFQPYSFYLGGRRSTGGLPNIPDYSLLAVEPPCDTVTSVSEITYGGEKISVYPNPANDKITINIHGDMNSVNVSLINVLGKEIFRDEIMNERVIDVSQFSKGIYFLELTVKLKNYKSVKKLVIQ